MGQSLWINISDKLQTFYKYCMNENCQLSVKEYLCWVLFWFVTFPWEETEFNATFVLTRQYTLCVTIFLRCHERGHFISQLRLAQILIGQIWNFAACQIRFCSLTRHLKWLGARSRTRDMTSWSLVFFLPQSLKRHCFQHSVLFRNVFMICINDFCHRGTVSLKWVIVCGSSETHGSQHSRVQGGRLHWQWWSLRKPWLMHFIIGLFIFAVKKDFKQPFLNKAKSA